MRDDLKGWLRREGLSGDAVLTIGETVHEREVITAGGLAGIVSGARYYEGTSHAI